MFWDKKDDKKLPDLPLEKIPISPVRPMIKELDTDSSYEKQTLPSFPDSAMKKGFAQSTIKDAVLAPQSKENFDDSLNHDEHPIKMHEFDEDHDDMDKPLRLGLPPERPLYNNVYEADSQKSSMDSKSTDIFVKIDKYYAAKKNIEAMKRKISDIDDILKRIRETKLREDQEITSWEKEISDMKSKLKEVDSTIFDKV